MPHDGDITAGYGLTILPLSGVVTASRDGVVLARSTQAKVMYETRLSPAIYFPRADVLMDLGTQTELQTFCPFKGTASYYNLPDQGPANAIWSYEAPLPESQGIKGHIAFVPGNDVVLDTGDNTLTTPDWGHVSGRWWTGSCARRPFATHPRR